MLWHRIKQATYTSHNSHFVEKFGDLVGPEAVLNGEVEQEEEHPLTGEREQVAPDQVPAERVLEHVLAWRQTK